MRKHVVSVRVAPGRGVTSLAVVIVLSVLVASLLAYASAAGTKQVVVSALAPGVITDLQFVTILPVGSDPQAIVATTDRVFVSDHNDANRALYAYNVGDWTLAGNWAQMAGNEGGAVLGDTVYFPDTFNAGDTQITRLIRIDANTLNITPIPLDFSTISYSVCPGDLSTNNDMTLSADGNTAYVLWNRGIAVVDLNTNTQTDFFMLPDGMACTDEIQYANGKLYISAFEDGGRLMVLNATTGAPLGDVFPAGSLQPAGLDRSPDGSTFYFNDFYGPRVGRVDAATDTLGAFVALPVGGNSFDLAADPTAGSPYVYVVREDGQRLEALNMVANTVENGADTPWFVPRAVETSPDGRYVYVAGQDWNWPPQGFLAVFEVVEDGAPPTPTPTATTTSTPTAHLIYLPIVMKSYP